MVFIVMRSSGVMELVQWYLLYAMDKSNGVDCDEVI